MSTEKKTRSSPLQQPTDLLDLPLDILVLIFEEYMRGPDAATPCGCLVKAKRQAVAGCQPLNLQLVNTALRKAFGRYLANRRWSMGIQGFDADIQTDLPCPKFWGSTPPRRLDVRFHGFYNLSALPSAFWSLSMLCENLGKFEPLRHLKIGIDVALPRPNAPFNIDLIELERAPLEVLILLQPFRTLHRMLDARVDVQIGNARRPLLEDAPIVSELIDGVQKHLMNTECVEDHNTEVLLELERRLASQEEFWRLCKDPAASCADLSRDLGKS